jgi:hypothetical protein
MIKKGGIVGQMILIKHGADNGIRHVSIHLNMSNVFLIIGKLKFLPPLKHYTPFVCKEN